MTATELGRAGGAHSSTGVGRDRPPEASTQPGRQSRGDRHWVYQVPAVGG